MVGVANGGLELPSASESGPPVSHGPCCLHLLVIILAPDNPIKTANQDFRGGLPLIRYPRQSSISLTQYSQASGSNGFIHWLASVTASVTAGIGPVCQMLYKLS